MKAPFDKKFWLFMLASVVVVIVGEGTVIFFWVCLVLGSCHFYSGFPLLQPYCHKTPGAAF
jgi:hypothetical protein